MTVVKCNYYAYCARGTRMVSANHPSSVICHRQHFMRSYLFGLSYLCHISQFKCKDTKKTAQMQVFCYIFALRLENVNSWLAFCSRPNIFFV